jgi:cytidine deaminase
MLDPLDRRLLKAARDRAARVPGDPRRTVAAAVMDTLGRIHTGVEADHFTGGPCAELAALEAATGTGPIVLMAAVDAERGTVVPPCGRCRQVLIDRHPDCHVIVPGPGGGQTVTVRSLLPHPYTDPDAHPERVVWFAGHYYEAVAAGRKVATTRFEDPVAVGPAWLVFESGEALRRLPAEVTSLEHRTLATLTDADARLEACTSAAELRKGLRGHYPQVVDDAPLTLVHFRATA